MHISRNLILTLVIASVVVVAVSGQYHHRTEDIHFNDESTVRDPREHPSSTLGETVMNAASKVMHAAKEAFTGKEQDPNVYHAASAAEDRLRQGRDAMEDAAWRARNAPHSYSQAELDAIEHSRYASDIPTTTTTANTIPQSTGYYYDKGYERPVGSDTMDKVRDKMYETQDNIARRAQDMSDKARDVKDTVADKARDVKDTVADKARDMKDTAADKASQWAQQAKDTAYDARDRAADSMRSAADTVSETARVAKDKAADTLASAADTLKDTASAAASKAGEYTQAGLDKAADTLKGTASTASYGLRYAANRALDMLNRAARGSWSSVKTGVETLGEKVGSVMHTSPVYREWTEDEQKQAGLELQVAISLMDKGRRIMDDVSQDCAGSDIKCRNNQEKIYRIREAEHLYQQGIYRVERLLRRPMPEDVSVSLQGGVREARDALYEAQEMIFNISGGAHPTYDAKIDPYAGLRTHIGNLDPHLAHERSREEL